MGCIVGLSSKLAKRFVTIKAYIISYIAWNYLLSLVENIALQDKDMRSHVSR